MECPTVKYAVSYSYCNWYGQEDFTWQEIWRTCIHLFNVRWNYHLMSYLSLMYRYGINTNILYFNSFMTEARHERVNIFSCRILIISYKMLIMTGISNERRNELTIHALLCRNGQNILPKGTSFFISSAGKIENVQEFSVKLFE